jgi:hypothetical protein
LRSPRPHRYAKRCGRVGGDSLLGLLRLS